MTLIEVLKKMLGLPRVDVEALKVRIRDVESENLALKLEIEEATRLAQELWEKYNSGAIGKPFNPS